MGALLSLQQLGKDYPDGDGTVPVLAGITLDIAAGEFVALLGPSGCGKSTLMNILGCLDRPSHGRYLVNGQDVATLDGDALAVLRRDSFGFVFQRYNLLAMASAEDNVALPAIYAGVGRQQRRQRAQQLLTRLGLGTRLTHKPGQLSGGQQQRVSIARALINDAPVILADEPTGALDSHSGEQVLALLQQLHREGRTIVLITHDLDIARHAERIVRLRDGRIESDSGALARPTLAAAVAATPAPVRQPAAVPWLETLHMALGSLRAKLFRTALTLLGVIIGVAAVVTMLAIGDGSKADVLQRIEAMGTNLLLVRPGAAGIRATGEIATLTAADASAMQGLPNIDGVVPMRSGSATLRVGNRDYQTQQVQGVWPSYGRVKDWTVSRGAFFGAAEERAQAAVIVLGQTVVDSLFPAGQEPVGQYVMVSNIPFEVVGVMSSKGANTFGQDQDDVAFVPLSTAQSRLFGGQFVSSITVKIADIGVSGATESMLQQLLRARHGSEDFQLRNTASLVEMITSTQNTLTLLLGSVAAVSLLVGGIGVMNIMLVSVTERTREIGLRMATGARMQAILLQFNVEAVLVCGLGGVIGIVLGLALVWGLRLGGVSVAFSLLPPLLAFGCAFATGCVFGYLPARKAAQLDPVLALAAE
ncbi:MacB family efflux pump subunit [Vogesella indigofera]|uniref:Pyoverdine export ATP-binding/permease protein PvdT n=1 Tax=Vogesella indigofera TaxID=45465 RepID=A0ABT5I160_VOGIN|nr:MacB family efflux pump subunit [Vogesella indigofera]MDC7689757.1 MacB family efflux pump subunit [Vogesella indigofera]